MIVTVIYIQCEVVIRCSAVLLMECQSGVCLLCDYFAMFYLYDDSSVTTATTEYVESETRDVLPL